MTAQRLIELQQLDTHVDQLRSRLPKLPEVLAAAVAQSDLGAWERRAAELRAQVEGLEAAISAAERANADLDTKRERLEKQLKTVIAPREAEALMHEISTLKTERSLHDDEELEAMEALSDAETALAAHLALEQELRERLSVAQAAAAEASAATEAEITSTASSRDATRLTFDEASLREYDAARAQHQGIAIAKLVGMQCDACHLDMSRAEVDQVKHLGPDEVGECPNCGRMIVP